MTCGIYCIKNKVNEKYYIGSTSTTFEERWKTHKWELKNNRHGNSLLQRAWNKYGEDNFEFSIIEIIDDKRDILTIEQLYLDFTTCCDRNSGYNLSLNTLNTQLGIKRTEETIIKLRKVVSLNKNKSGYSGVNKTQNNKKWSVSMNFNNKKYNLGYYDTPEEAHNVYLTYMTKNEQEILNFKDEIKKKTKSKCTSKYYGVSYKKSKNKWRVLVINNKKTLLDKLFPSELEAAIFYNNFVTTNNLNKKLNEL